MPPNKDKILDITQIKTLDQFPLEDEALTMLLYGRTKTGKTRFAGTFGSRTFYIDIGGGFLTLRSPGFNTYYSSLYPNDPIYKPIRARLSDDDDFPLYEKVIQAFDYALDKIPDQFDTIVLDDASTMNDAAMDKAIQVNYSTERSKLAKETLNKHAVKIVGRQDFGTQMGIMDHFLGKATESCKSMGKNFIVLAHEKEKYKPSAGKNAEQVLVGVSPLFTGNNKIASHFDMVWRMEVNAGMFRARTKQNEIYEAGTRWDGVFDEFYKNPNYPEIAKLLKRK